MVPYISIVTCVRNIRSIFGTVKKGCPYLQWLPGDSGRLLKMEVDPRVFGEDHFVDDVLRKAGSQSEQKLDIDTILKVVETVYRITLEELSKPGQDRWRSEARSMACSGPLTIDCMDSLCDVSPIFLSSCS